MKKQLNRMMVVGVALAVICTFVAIDCVGQWKAEAWDRIPIEMKTRIVTHDCLGDRALSVMIFPATKKAFDLFVPGNEDLHFPSDPWLIFAVAPYGNQYWLPEDVVFTQGTAQYGVGLFDYYSQDEAFSGGKLRKGVVIRGMIQVPKGIDITKPFKVWVDDDSGIIEAFYGIEDDPGEDE